MSADEIQSICEPQRSKHRKNRNAIAGEDEMMDLRSEFRSRVPEKKAFFSRENVKHDARLGAGRMGFAEHHAHWVPRSGFVC